MSSHSTTIGVLAFQGDFAEHMDVLRGLGITCREVRTPEELEGIDRLIIPGGESTVIGKFLAESGMDRAIRDRVGAGTLAVYGTCAGAIILARRVHGGYPFTPLKLVDMTIGRNAYGTQLQSFEAAVKVRGMKDPVQAAFIRAPRIEKVGSGVEVLATHDDHPVLVRQGRVLAGTFHPEVRSNADIHRFFLEM